MDRVLWSIRRAKYDEIMQIEAAVSRRIAQLESYKQPYTTSQLKDKLWAAWHKSGSPTNMRKEVRIE